MRRITVWILICIAAVLTYVSIQIGDPSATAPPADSGSADSQSVRIVAMSPAIAVILDDLGLAEFIVGRHAFDLALDPSIPVVGDMTGIDYERLLRLDPTHILLERSAKSLPGRLQTLASEHAWTIRSFPLLALDDIPSTIEQIAEIFDTEQTRINQTFLQDEFRLSMQPAPASALRAGRVLPLFWTNPPGAAGPGSFHYEMLERLGFELALTEGGPYITIDPEDILRMDPDSILLLMPGADPDRLDELLGPLVNLNLRCVREGRVGVVNDPMVNLPATSLTAVIQEIVELTANWTQTAQGGVN